VHYMPSDLGDQQTEPGQWKGLSPLGAEVIRECNRLGVVVDVAHGTYELVEQAARVSTVPFILSHTSLPRGPLRPYTRLISAEHARLMAQAGGVIGIWPNGNLFVNAQAWVADIARTVEVAGVDHVGIGSDFDGITDLVLVKGPQSRLLWANKAFRELYGMSNEQLQGMIDAPFNEPDYTLQYIKDDQYVFENEKTLVIPEEPVTRHDGDVRTFRTVKSPIRNAAGEVIGTVGISQDITELKQKEAKDRAIGEQRRLIEQQQGSLLHARSRVP